MAKILQVCNTDFYLNKFLLPLVRALVARGHQVDCLTNGSALAPELQELGVRVHPYRFPSTSSPIAFLRSLAPMVRLIRREKYDCINSHNRNASIVARIAAYLARSPLSVYTAHGFYFHDDQSAIAREATIAFEAILARITDVTLSQSQEDHELMVGRGHIDAERIFTIGNGIDVTRFTPDPDARADLERQLNLSSDVFRFGSVGRLVQGKGFSDLLEAFALVHRDQPKTELVIIGGNIAQDIAPFERQFLDRVHALNLDDAVRVTGLTDRIEASLRTLDCFVLPSYREGLPRALVEAMASGVPCVATDIRGCREAIRHGLDGFLFPPHDIENLARYLRRIVEMPAEDRRMMRDAAVARARARFSEVDYVERQVELIERFLAQPTATDSSASKLYV